MRRCIICRFLTELDDIAIRGPDHVCVCLGCFARETGTALPMPRPLERAVCAVLVAIDT